MQHLQRRKSRQKPSLGRDSRTGPPHPIPTTTTPTTAGIVFLTLLAGDSSCSVLLHGAILFFTANPHCACLPLLQRCLLHRCYSKENGKADGQVPVTHARTQRRDVSLRAVPCLPALWPRGMGSQEFAELAPQRRITPAGPPLLDR